MKGRREPLIAGAGMGLLVLLLIFFLVLPKMSEVGEARTELEEAKSETVTLESQLRALEDARDRAGEARRIIAEVDRQIPPTSDLPGLLLLLENAAVGSGLETVSLNPSTPAFDATTGLSTITVAVNATGTYFDVAEFLFRIETLPRAAKATSVSLTPGGTSDTVTFGSPELSFTTSVDLYTSDTSAGPGSIPGPTTGTPPEAGG